MPLHWKLERLYNAAEAADFLGYSETWFHQHIKQYLKPRQVPGYKYPYYEESELKEMKERRKRSITTEE